MAPDAGTPDAIADDGDPAGPRLSLDIVTIFPDYFAPLELSLIGKARDQGLLAWRVHDLRSWTHDRHRTVDDTPYGGGAGMVMSVPSRGASPGCFQSFSSSGKSTINNSGTFSPFTDNVSPINASLFSPTQPSS